MKTFTLRLTDDEAKLIEIMATVSRLSKNSVVRGCVHTIAHIMYEAGATDSYRPKANDLIKSNEELFNNIKYDSIEVLGENFDDVL